LIGNLINYNNALENNVIICIDLCINFK
jgi:hypothetical protein